MSSGAVQTAALASHKRRQVKLNLDIPIETTPINQDVNVQDGPANLAHDTALLTKLGRGAGGTVYLSLYKPLVKLIAVKVVSVFDHQERQMIMHELNALHQNLVPINHGSFGWLFHIGAAHPCPQIVSFYGAFSNPTEPKVSIVMEYMDAGSLQDLIETNSRVPETVLTQIAFCCLKALDHMHQHRMIHRDIKPANILATIDGMFKIADFGLAITLSKSKTFFSDFKGTMMYMAPERITGQSYSYASDLWSVGVVLASLALGHFPFTVSDGFFGLEDTIVNDTVPQLSSSEYSRGFQDLITGLLQKDPKDRLTAREALGSVRDKQASLEFQRQWAQVCPKHGRLPDEALNQVCSAVADKRQETLSKEYIGLNLTKYIPAVFNPYQREIAHLASACGVTTEEMYTKLQLQVGK